MKPTRRAVRWGKNLIRAGLRFFQTAPDAYLKRVHGVIHVGASIGQERDLYAQHNLHVAWIEPLPDVFPRLLANIERFPRQKAYRYLVTDQEGREYTFHVSSNNGESSSILEFAQGKDFWPQISFSPELTLTSTTLAALVRKENIDIGKHEALVMDTQGSELLVLKGAVELLPGFKYIKTEAADFEIYQGCCRLGDLTAFLAKYGFVRERIERSACDRARNCYEVLYRNKSARA